MSFFPGVALVWGAAAFGLASIWGYSTLLRGNQPALGFARRTYWLFAASVVGASALLMTKLLVHDFRIGYVASYSSLDLPLHYLVSTFWAGQEGSFLLWLLCGALIGIPLYRSAREQEPATMIVHLATLLALVAILMRQSPFRFVEGEVPVDGKGLNPLLQNPWMVIHPPMMFLGFASLGVPFSFAVAGLWRRRYDSWIVRSLPWVLVTFVSLGTAILMGGYWAYVTLGWGGYWAWDPVENTSLVPWLATTALLHGMWVQRKKGRYRRLNFSLAILAYVCILYGTFLTRSGVLADFSVHSFVDLGITGWLVAILVTFLVGGTAMIVWRWREIPAEEISEPFLSKGVFLLLGISSLVASAFVILLGTSAPLITRLGENPSQVATSFYRVTCSPVALVVLLLLGFLPVIDWKGGSGAGMLRRSIVPLAIGLIATGIAWGLGLRHPLLTPMIGACWFAFAASLARYGRNAKGGVWAAGAGYLTHAGLALMMAGIVVSSGFDSSRRITLDRDRPVIVEGREITFLGPRIAPDGRDGMELRIRRPGETGSWTAIPRMWTNPRTRQLMANPDVKEGVLRDLYVSPQEYAPGHPAEPGGLLELRRGESRSVGPWQVLLRDFDVDVEKMMSDGANASVGVELVVTRDGRPSPLRLDWAVRSTDGGERASTPLPGGPAGASIRIQGLSAESGQARLRIVGPAELVGETPGSPERFVADLTVKPLISLVWAGFGVMMAGGLLALVNRRRASLREGSLPEEPRPEPRSPDRGSDAETGAPVGP
jgi:cytochrome c-type biogenesis protein CcmF